MKSYLFIYTDMYVICILYSDEREQDRSSKKNVIPDSDDNDLDRYPYHLEITFFCILLNKRHIC